LCLNSTPFMRPLIGGPSPMRAMTMIWSVSAVPLTDGGLSTIISKPNGAIGDFLTSSLAIGRIMAPNLIDFDSPSSASV
ncbi:hypothetical protein Ancab_014540, partial [Ancistrocladus abbreviatus]